jgi:hypothetical protein
LHQAIQNIRNGRLSVKEFPDPIAKPGHVLIANAFSVVSSVAEVIVIELAEIFFGYCACSDNRKILFS